MCSAKFLLMLGEATLSLAVLSARWEPETHSGTLLSTMGAQLVIADEHHQMVQTYTVAADAKITLDRKTAKLDELMAGDFVKLTLGSQSNAQDVEQIEAYSREPRCSSSDL